MSNRYATDETAYGVVTHDLLKGGLRMESTLTRGGRTATLGVEWDDQALARQNYENARKAALKRMKTVAGKLDAVIDGEVHVSRIRTLLKSPWGKLKLYTNTGPPTWWLPDLGIEHRNGRGLRAGWLRGCLILYWESR